MSRLLKALGSLFFAILLLAMLVVVLAVSTTLESLYGTALVQKFFYQAGWFDVFLGLFWINIFCATILRWPFKKHHVGFVTTHIGILTLLAGCLLSRLFGVEGQMALYEGQKSHRILQSTYELLIHGPGGGQTASFDLNSKVKGRQKTAFIGDETIRLDIKDLNENAVIHSQIQNDEKAPLNFAAELSLYSERAGADQTFWLVEHDPTNPDAATLSMGPARFELRRSKKPEKEAVPLPTTPQLVISDQKSGKNISIDLQKIPSETKLEGTAIRLSDFRYYPNARVENNKLLSVSDEPLNPAVEFKATDDKGHERLFIHFALFPDFESIHGKKGVNPIDLKIEFTLPHAEELPSSSPSLIIYAPENGSWHYESKSSRGTQSGQLKIGETYETGWMDFRFKATQLLEHAISVPQVHKSQGQGRMAVNLKISDTNSQIVFEDWVIEEEPKAFSLKSGQKMMVGIARKKFPVPFILELKDFRKVDYPGTDKPQSFESDVALADPTDQVKIEKTIKMNKPMDYKGFRIFQSSYIQDPEHGEASVFTVAKNPGIGAIYTGAAILFLGVVLIFYIKPFSADQKGFKK